MFVRSSVRAAALSLASAAIAVSALTAAVPASAGSVSATTQTVASTTTTAAQDQGSHRWRYYDSYKHRSNCRWQGEFGEDHRNWRDYECRKQWYYDHHGDKHYYWDLWYRK